MPLLIIAPITAVDAILSLCSNGVALIVIIITSWWVLRTNSIRSRNLFPILLIFVNTLTIFLVMIGTAMCAYSIEMKSAGRLIYNVAVMFDAIVIGLLALLDVFILEKFRILESRITDTVLKRLKIVLLCIFVICAFPNIPATFMTSYPEFLSSWITIGYLVFAVTCVLYDNCQNIWLALLIFEWKKTPGAKANEAIFKKAIQISCFGVLLDWIAIALDLINILLGKQSGFYIGLNSVVISICALHMANALLSFSTLTKLALGRTANSHQKPSLQIKKAPTEEQQRDTVAEQSQDHDGKKLHSGTVLQARYG